MTACAMSSDYGSELLLGSSPVLTSAFQTAGASCFSDYSRLSANQTKNVLWDTSASATASSPYCSAEALVEQFADLNVANNFSGRYNYARTGSLRRSKKLDRLKRDLTLQYTPLLFTNPAKSCLRQIEEQQQQDHVDDTLPISPSREKKKVSFADTIGRQLAQVKLFMERSDTPPKWSQDFIEKVTGGVTPAPAVKEWELSFSQPVADYINFKNKLDREYVTLENAVIDSEKKIIKGTISVRNMSFHKEVVVLYTTNSWTSTKEASALYVPCLTTSSSYDLYDRFSFEFRLPTPSESDKIEFCIRFSCNGGQYWDNNNERNYTVVSFRSKDSPALSIANVDDSYRANLQNLSDFAFWKLPSAASDTPYW